MKTPRWTHTQLTVSAIVGVILIVGLVSAAWSLSSVDHLATGKQQQTFDIHCDFDKFRQIMVRKDATRAIITHGGMRLIDVKFKDLQVDASHDARPLLNAIRGKSQAELAAVKEITVNLDDPALEADRIVLRQQADIQPEMIQVVTRSKAPAGNLEFYETTLQAQPQADITRVELTVTMQVHVKVPRVFAGRADEKVQQAADKAIEEQARSLEAFVGEFANERLILPDLKR